MNSLFDGLTFEDDRDGERLFAQLLRVWHVIADGRWYTLADISARTGDPAASVSARLRDFRKDKWGGHEVRREYVSQGLWRYRLVPQGAAVEAGPTRSTGGFP